MKVIDEVKADVEGLTDGRWERADFFRAADLLTKLALLLTLAAPAVCPASSDAPALAELEASSGTDSE